jgi:hypothetical protein
MQTPTGKPYACSGIVSMTFKWIIAMRSDPDDLRVAVIDLSIIESPVRA